MVSQPIMHYREFFARLGMSREGWRKAVRHGTLPAPERVKGTRLVVWSDKYLARCQRARAKHK